ncbi:MAG: hypothetical protein EZS28_050970, partial [Streblomastix strix]
CYPDGDIDQGINNDDTDYFSVNGGD